MIIHEILTFDFHTNRHDYAMYLIREDMINISRWCLVFCCLVTAHFLEGTRMQCSALKGGRGFGQSGVMYRLVYFISNSLPVRRHNTPIRTFDLKHSISKRPTL